MRAGKFRNLIKQLSRDPQVKQVIAQARRRNRGRGGAEVENLADIFTLIFSIASRFMKKKKARSLDALLDIVYFLVQVSLLLKENIFDRPEVKEFFSQSSRHIYLSARKFVAMVLPETKGLRARYTSRSV